MFKNIIRYSVCAVIGFIMADTSLSFISAVLVTMLFSLLFSVFLDVVVKDTV